MPHKYLFIFASIISNFLISFFNTSQYLIFSKCLNVNLCLVLVNFLNNSHILKKTLKIFFSDGKMNPFFAHFGKSPVIWKSEFS